MYTGPLLGSAGAILQRPGQIRSGFRQSHGKIKREQGLKELFPTAKKRKKYIPWTHRFVCLATHNQTSIPTTAVEKDVLISAGLGEKNGI